MIWARYLRLKPIDFVFHVHDEGFRSKGRESFCVLRDTMWGIRSSMRLVFGVRSMEEITGHHWTSLDIDNFSSSDMRLEGLGFMDKK